MHATARWNPRREPEGHVCGRPAAEPHTCRAPGHISRAEGTSTPPLCLCNRPLAPLPSRSSCRSSPSASSSPSSASQGRALHRQRHAALRVRQAVAAHVGRRAAAPAEGAGRRQRPGGWVEGWRAQAGRRGERGCGGYMGMRGWTWEKGWERGCEERGCGREGVRAGEVVGSGRSKRGRAHTSNASARPAPA